MRTNVLALSLLAVVAAAPLAHSQESIHKLSAKVIAAGSATSLAVSPSSVFNGTPVVLKADVQPTQGGPTPTGTVTFYGQGFLLGTATLSGTTASITVPTRGLPQGTYEITADYSGSATYAASKSGQVSVFVSCDSNSTSDMAASPASLKEGGTVTFATDVSPNQGGAIPTGIVKFYEIHGSYIGQATLVWGVATLNVSTAGITPGTYQIYSVYQGDSIYEPSTSETDTVVVTAN
jgi:hypothetical protein